MQVALYKIKISIIVGKHMWHEAFIKIYIHLSVQSWKLQIRVKIFIGIFRVLPEAVLGLKNFPSGGIEPNFLFSRNARRMVMIAEMTKGINRIGIE